MNSPEGDNRINRGGMELNIRRRLISLPGEILFFDDVIVTAKKCATPRISQCAICSQSTVYFFFAQFISSFEARWAAPNIAPRAGITGAKDMKPTGLATSS